MSTHNIFFFRGEIRKLLCECLFISGAMVCSSSWCLVCVEVLWPSQPNGVMSSAVSLPNHYFTGQAQSTKRLTSIVHILSPETDNYHF